LLLEKEFFLPLVTGGKEISSEVGFPGPVHVKLRRPVITRLALHDAHIAASLLEF
jgi:hypothetical protein